MSWKIVPLHFGPFDFHERQRSMFDDWLGLLDDDWREMERDAARLRFDRELDRARKEMHQMETGVPHELDIPQPFVVDAEGNQKMSLRFDCRGFKPEEINVKTIDDVTLQVHAKHESESPGSKVYREFTRTFKLPPEVHSDELKSLLTQDGVLQIEAPVHVAVEAPKEILIPIERMHSTDKSGKECGEGCRDGSGDKEDK
uniref:Heat shock protein 23 n=1 Tax=Sinonovacula constricta TaxID=98310 RepID=M9MTF0_SINCO|nr:heat shock protein 23 [Sinonovacula constricta]